MTYSDPTDFVGGTNGAHTNTNVGYANLQHVVVKDNAGNTHDYIIVEGNLGATELYTIESDGSLNLEQTIQVGGSEQQSQDQFTVINDSDSNAVYLFDTDSTGSNALTWDPVSASWSNSFQPNTDFFSNGQVKLDVYQADDGTIYGYAGSTSTSGTDKINQYIFNETTKEFVFDKSYTPSGSLGKDFNSNWEEMFETSEMQVLLTNDGPKLLQWNAGGVDRTEGFTLYDIDPATGDLIDGSASSYNFASSADASAFGTDPEFLVTNLGIDESFAGGQASEVIVDANGNIVMLNGTWGSGEASSIGMIVIDPRLSVPDSADASQDGDGDVNNSASVLQVYYENGTSSLNNGIVSPEAWGSNPEVTYSPDGKYMYLTSSNTTGSLDSVNTHTIVIDRSDYSVVDWGADTTSGYYSTDPSNSGATTAYKGSMSQIIVTLSSGEQFYIDQYNDFANATTGWLAVSSVTANVTCFARGTQIKTLYGEINVEDLKEGTPVLTTGSSYQPVRWIGSRKFGPSDLKKHPNIHPIRIKPGALGRGLPYCELLVSPQHRVLVNAPAVERMFNTKEVLIAAKQLLALEGIEIAHDLEEIEYWHFLLDDHQVIYSNGARTETMFTGPEAIKSVSPEAREEIFTIFPELKEQEDTNLHEPARLLPKGKRGRHLAARLAKNSRFPQH